MRKLSELNEEKSCLNRALSHEMLFVLLTRDPASPYAIRAWVEARINLGKNKRDDLQITEALEVARTMEKERWKP